MRAIREVDLKAFCHNVMMLDDVGNIRFGYKSDYLLHLLAKSTDLNVMLKFLLKERPYLDLTAINIHD